MSSRSPTLTGSTYLYVEADGSRLCLLGTGTHDSLLEAGEFVRTLQHRQGVQIAWLEEIAFEMNFISADQARAACERLQKPFMAPLF